ncbi:bifunctional phosphopantothenoylcysteine decarboxylase/phosphopantothenate--cysteine ligase CoaBC [uncultured Limosilactobacillus sp.]|uniref:bifunctional phosphopantothenoylcysteine decarboxylase/phosphopantothenate--cysteine ligase CoaBC n=1 Tax=uncultured Limosilactobacillus sp. TaxID=2837629 RepID=UPI0025FDBA33|nr:bifunctional phosphopantothenoylcysteine decarboxylase/phosphopantothenate--cysteine ligase CoaBC [uncultured Limosilactobacillus sp.]
MAKILVHVSGSIAAFKAVTVVRRLQRDHHQVRVTMTKSATQLIGPATFAALTHYPVLTDLWQPSVNGSIPHIELADWADYSIVVPASADVIAKLANGIADDAVTTTVLATATPVVIVPAMNTHMWNQLATQRNIDQLRRDGRIIMEPVKGQLAEGYSGDGRMPEPTAVTALINDLMANHHLLQGKSVLISLGGTVAPIDPVRYIGNWSSGKMGWAIAQAALKMGADVTVVAGRTSIALKEQSRLTIQRVQTTQEMYEAISKAFPQCDVLIMAAAVADFTPTKMISQKIKKQDDQTGIQLQLTPAIDILRTMGHQKNHQIVVGFAAETKDVLANAQKKLVTKGADIIVANDVSQKGTGFDADNNQVTILRAHQEPLVWPLASKNQIGLQLMQLIKEMLS